MTETTYDLEYSICGALCLDARNVSGRISGILTAEDFTVRDCAALFSAVMEDAERGVFHDAPMIAEKLRDTVADAAGFVGGCMAAGPTAANVEVEAVALHSRARADRLKTAVSSALFECSGDDLASALMDVCKDYFDQEHSRGTRSIGEIVATLYSEQDKKDEHRINTGFPKLDSIMHGMTAGELVLIAARPGVGKSAFAVNLAAAAASSGRSVLLFTMEMTAEEVGKRTMSQASGVPLVRLTDGGTSNEEWRKLSHGCGTLHGLPLYINDSPNVTTADIRRTARTIPDLSMIVVDYIGLMKPARRTGQANRNLELGEISRDLKNLAQELKIPVVALSQLNRQALDTEKPQLFHLRDSGELEQNANKILFLWKEDEENGVVGVRVAKNRNGRTGEAFAAFFGDTMRFQELPEYTPKRKAQRSRILSDED